MFTFTKIRLRLQNHLQIHKGDDERVVILRIYLHSGFFIIVQLFSEMKHKNQKKQNLAYLETVFF